MMIRLLIFLFAALASAACGIECVWENGIGLRDDPFQQKQYDAVRTPRWTPDGQTLIVNVGARIFGVSVDGSSAWTIPAEPERGGQFSPVVAPDGRVAFLNYEYRPRTGFVRAGSSPHRSNIGVVRSDGEDLEFLPLPSRSGATAPVWVPGTGRAAIAFSGFVPSVPPPVHSIYIADLDGEVASLWQTETTDYRNFEHLAWSPDGRYAAFYETYDTSRLVVADISSDGSKLNARLRMDVDAEYPESITSLAWSTASDRVFFAITGEYVSIPANTRTGSIRKPTNTTIWAAPTDGNAPVPVAQVEPPRRLLTVQPSPDGSKLLLTTGHNQPVSVMNIDGSDRIALCCPTYQPNPFNNFWASWSPNGEWVAILDTQSAASDVLQIMRPDGSDARTLIHRNEDGSLTPGTAR